MSEAVNRVLEKRPYQSLIDQTDAAAREKGGMQPKPHENSTERISSPSFSDLCTHNTSFTCEWEETGTLLQSSLPSK